MNTKRPLLMGLAGSLFLALLYLGILTIAESLEHAVTQFISMWPWITLLLIGFGVQLGLYTFSRMLMKDRNRKATAEVATTGGVSAAAMVACCAHHLVGVLPILGFSTAAVFLAEFQVPFIVLGIVSNILGISLMLYLMQKHGCIIGARFLSRLFALDLKRVTAVVGTASALAVGSAFLFVGVRANADTKPLSVLEFASVVNDENYVTFEITPVDFGFDRPVVFEIKMNTHQVDLGFSLMDIAALKVDDDIILDPIAWDGTAPGGHHRDGKLTFPAIPSLAEHLILVIRNVADVEERIFEWQIN